MDKKLIFFIVKRYLRFDREHPFIFLSAVLAYVGIAVGVMVLMVAMAIMNGFDKEFEKKLFTMNYPLTIYPRIAKATNETLVQTLQKAFPDLLFSPYLSTQVIVKSGSLMEGGVIFGVDFAKESRINEILAQALRDKKISKFGAVVGKELYVSMGLERGQKAMFIFTQTEPGGIGIMPLMKRFEIEEYFSSGLIAYDKAYVYTTLEALRAILHLEEGVYDGIHVYSKEPMADIKRLEKFLPPEVGVVGWWQQNGNFFAALQMEKRALFIVLMLIILIASLNIVSSLLMTVMNRRKEIALMLSLGATAKEVRAIFFYLGMVIGASGVATGILLGFAGIFLLGSFDIITLPADVYGTSKLPLDLSAGDFAGIMLGAALIILFSAFYPAKVATRIDVLDVLRNE